MVFIVYLRGMIGGMALKHGRTLKVGNTQDGKNRHVDGVVDRWDKVHVEEKK